MAAGAPSGRCSRAWAPLRPRSRRRRRTGGAASTGGSAASCCGGRARRWQRPRRALALLLAGLLAFQPNYDQLASLPDNTESVRSFELLRSSFPAGELSPTRVFVSLPPGEQALDPERLDQLDSLTLALAGHPAVASAAGPSRPFGTGGPEGGPDAARARFVSADGGTARIDVVLTENPFATQSLDAVPELRRLAREGAASAGLDPAAVLVGGDTAEAADTRTAGDRDSRVVLPLILLAIGVVLALLLRSLIAPLYLMATIAFTYFATLGLAVAVFILLLGHEGIGPGVPFFLFVFLNALSVDYNIYLMSRIREEARPRSAEGGDRARARPHGSGHHLGRPDPRGDVLGADDAAAPGSDAARLRGRDGRADRHVHHAHADRPGAGRDLRALELVALAHRRLSGPRRERVRRGAA